MKVLPVISSILLAVSLASADDGIQYVSLEVPALSGEVATLRVVVRGTDGKEAAVSEALVVDVLPLDGGKTKKPLATITVEPGTTSGTAKVPRKYIASEIETTRIHGLIRVGDTGLHACEVLPTPAATAVAN